MSMQFNETYYLDHNADVDKAVSNGEFKSAQQHWELFGAKEGRNPNAIFNTTDYLAANEDVAESGMNPLDHFLQFGAAEGRAPSDSYAAVAKDFDADDYLEANQDVADAVEDGDFDSAYHHWVLFGQFEDDRDEATYDDGTPVSEAIADNVEDNGDDNDDNDGDDNDDNGIDGETHDLTVGADNLEGTADNDVFNAGIGQNDAGQIVNTLSSADVIDGGAGNDTLNASLSQEAGIGGETLNVQPTTSSVENINIEARSSNAGGEGNPAGTVNLDAKNMTGVDTFGSDYSDGDLVIQNVNTLDDDGNARNTSDMTIRMDHTSNFDSIGDASDLTVLFDDDYLLAGQDTSASQANYWLLDQDSPDYVNEPLLHAERDGIEFDLDGENYKIIADEVDAEAANTWEDFAQLMQTGIDRRVADGDDTLKDISVVVDPDNIRQTYNDAGDLVTIPAITLIDGQGRDIQPTGFHTPEKATGGYNIFGRYDNEPSETTDQPVSVNVELDKVGRAGEGGNLEIGGKSQVEVDGQQNGIEVFDIDVLGDESRPSSLGSITSTNGTLNTINIATGDEFAGEDSVAGLTVRGYDQATGEDAYNPFGDNVDMVNATEFEGDLTIGTTDQEGSYAQNVDLNADGALGDVTYNASYDDNANGIVKTGEGDDEINLIGDGNAVINTGAGDDTVTGGAVSIDVDAGAGNDAVYVDNSGDKGAIEAFDTSALEQAAEGDNDEGYSLLFGRTVTVSVNGIDATAEVEANNVEEGRYLTNQDDLNDAIVKAVEDSEALSDLVEVEVVNGELTFTSKIDGAENNVEIGVSKSSWSESDLDSLKSEYQAANQDSNLNVGEQGEVATEETTLEGGSNSDAVNANTVRLGAGEDTVVLSTSANAADTVVFDGSFGDTTLLNFNVENDGLNFDAVLNSMKSASGSDASKQRIETTHGTDDVLSANEVNTQTFSGNDVVESFDDLTAGNLLDVIDFSAESYTNGKNKVELVGQDGTAIAMVQNDENPGEYKVFQVNFDGDAEDGKLTSSNISDLGNLDLGSEDLNAADAAIEAGINNFNDGIVLPGEGDDTDGDDNGDDVDGISVADAGEQEDGAEYVLADSADNLLDTDNAEVVTAATGINVTGDVTADQAGDLAAFKADNNFEGGINIPTVTNDGLDGSGEVDVDGDGENTRDSETSLEGLAIENVDTDFSNVDGGKNSYANYNDADADTEFSIQNASAQSEAGVGKVGINVNGLDGGDTLTLNLSDNAEDSYYSAVSDATTVAITAEEGNSGVINLGTDVTNITVEGAGDLSFQDYDYSSLDSLDASASSGDITFGGVDMTGTEPELSVKDGAKITTGSGDDTITVGADSNTLTGGEGDDTFAFTDAEGTHTIADFKAGEDQIDLSGLFDGGVTFESVDSADDLDTAGEFFFDNEDNTLTVGIGGADDTIAITLDGVDGVTAEDFVDIA